MSVKKYARKLKEKESLGKLERFPHSGTQHIERVGMDDKSTKSAIPSFDHGKFAVDFQGRFVVPSICSRETKTGPAKRDRAGPNQSRELGGRTHVRRSPAGAALPKIFRKISLPNGLHLTAIRRRVTA
jgi:hypothetical protein